MDINSEKYPTISEIAQDYAVPESLKYFLGELLRSKDLVNVWGQNIIQDLRPRSGTMPCQIGLALQLDHKYGSKYLIEKLHSFGYCSSYKEVEKYKWAYLKHKACSDPALSVSNVVTINDDLSDLDDDLDDESIIYIDDENNYDSGEYNHENIKSNQDIGIEGSNDDQDKVIEQYVGRQC